MKALVSHNQPLVYSLEGAGLVDSLPYVDTHLFKSTPEGMTTDKSMVKKVRKMIAEEFQTLEKSGPKNLLESLPVPKTPLLDKMLSSNSLSELEEQMLGKRNLPAEGTEIDLETKLKKQITETSQLSNQ